MQKDQLRLKLKQKRLQLSETERRLCSQKICDRLNALDWSGVKIVHCFRPMLELGEVDVSPFINKLLSRNPEIRVYISEKINGEWRIVSRQGQTETQNLQFNAIIVPMLGFDNSLHRIGYGGGYYDRFLANQQNAQKIGVSYESGKITSIPDESHDVALDQIITDQHVHSLG